MVRLLWHRALLEGHHRDSHKCMRAVKDNPCKWLALDHLDASHNSLHDSILLCIYVFGAVLSVIQDQVRPVRPGDAELGICK